jgi:hypothetical protein
MDKTFDITIKKKYFPDSVLFENGISALTLIVILLVIALIVSYCEINLQ